VSHALPLRYPSAGDLPAAGSAPLTDFGVATSATGEQMVVAVRREIDAATVLETDSVFDTAIALGHPRASPVTVDLSDLDDTAIAGLVVIAADACRFASWGGQLTLRSSRHVAGGSRPRSDPPHGSASNPLPPTVLDHPRADSGLRTYGRTRPTGRVAH
jgi:hypothetical protein